MTYQSHHGTGSDQLSGLRLLLTQDCVALLREQAVIRLSRRLAKHAPDHATAIMYHALGYLDRRRPTKAELFHRYLAATEILDNVRRISGLPAVQPISLRSFERLATFGTVLTRAYRGGLALAQAFVRAEPHLDWGPIQVLSETRPAFLHSFPPALDARRFDEPSESNENGDRDD